MNRLFGPNLFYPYRVFTILALFFLGGIFLAAILPSNFAQEGSVFLLIWIATIFALSAIGNFLLGNKYLVLLSICLVSMILGLFFFFNFQKAKVIPLEFGQDLEIQGMIVRRPEIDSKAQKVVVAWQRENSKVNLLVSMPIYPKYHYGDTLKFTGKLEEPKNFADFDYKGYLKSRLIFGVVEKPTDVRMIDQEGGTYDRLLAGLYGFSASFESILNRILPEPHASLASGILLGVKRNIPDNLMADLQTTGLTHIIALSGFNVTIILVVLTEILLNLVNRRQALSLGALFAVAFVLMTGAAASVLRAVIFTLLLMFGRLIGRRADATNLMLLAALLMVLANPFVLYYDLGFQLSFLAFAGLIYLAPWFKKLFKKRAFRLLPGWVKLALAETLGAQLMVMPLIFVKFGVISLISPIANLLVVLVVPVAMAAVFLAGTFGLIYYPLGKVGGLLAWPLLEYIIRMVEWLARLPFAALNF